jgi:hypothetical protein
LRDLGPAEIALKDLANPSNILFDGRPIKPVLFDKSLQLLFGELAPEGLFGVDVDKERHALVGPQGLQEQKRQERDSEPQEGQKEQPPNDKPEHLYASPHALQFFIIRYILSVYGYCEAVA